MKKEKKKSEAVDMTTGNPGKRILFFALPMIFGNVFQQLYSMVDSAVVGRYVGKQALASVGATLSVLNMVIFVIIGLTVGTCIITGQSFGAGNEEKVRDTAGVAWATVLSEAVAALVNLNRIQRKHPILHFRKENLKPKPAIVKHILA